MSQLPRVSEPRLLPVDLWTLVYLGVTALALARAAPVDPPPALWLAHGLLLAVVQLAPRARRAGGVGRFVGEFYPLLLLLALYTEVGLLNAARGVAHDVLVQRWEQALFDGQPARDWIRAWPSPALGTLLHAGYLAYFPILVASTLGLWLAGRRAGARRVLLLMMATFYVCYSIFLVFPVAGPRYLWPLADNAASATPVARFTHALVAGGSAWGTAFPSSHVAVALVVSVSAWREWRALGRPLLVATTLLACGTVFGQFHYAVDALAGAALGALVLGVSWRRAGAPAGAARA